MEENTNPDIAIPEVEGTMEVENEDIEEDEDEDEDSDDVRYFNLLFRT